MDPPKFQLVASDASRASLGVGRTALQNIQELGPTLAVPVDSGIRVKKGETPGKAFNPLKGSPDLVVSVLFTLICKVVFSQLLLRNVCLDAPRT